MKLRHRTPAPSRSPGQADCQDRARAGQMYSRQQARRSHCVRARTEPQQRAVRCMTVNFRQGGDEPHPPQPPTTPNAPVKEPPDSPQTEPDAPVREPGPDSPKKWG